MPAIARPALAFLLFALASSGARAQLIVNDSAAFVNSLAIVDGSSVDPAGILGSADSFDETSEASLDPALGRATLRSSMSASSNSLAITASGSCRSQVSITGDREVDLQRLGDASGQVRVVFTLTERATFSVSGSIAAAGENILAVNFSSNPAGGSSIHPLALFVEGGPDGESGSDSGSASGELEPGVHGILANCQTTAPRNHDLAPVGAASFQFTLTVDVPEAGEVFRWVGPNEGAFGEDENWDPEGPATAGVPSFVPGERSDTALFEGGRVRLDIAALAAASRAPRGVPPQCAGPVSRTIGRLVLDSTRDLEPVNGSLALDSLSLDERSLTVEDNGFLDLKEATLCARHAAIGATGRPSAALVAGPGGVLQTLGRLSVGSRGEGALRIQGGGIASSEAVRLGDGDKRGSALVSDATWQTGNLAVGFQSAGDLSIENVGLVESEGAFVDRDLNPLSGDVARATVRGAGSLWRVGELTIGGRGTVEVEDGAHLETFEATPQSSTRVLVGQPEDPGEATLLVNSGGELRVRSLEVGGVGRGRLIVAEAFDRNPLVDADFLLTIGDTPGSSGRVQVSGDPSTDGFSLVADEMQIGDGPGSRGELSIDFGAKVLTSTNAFVGGEGGNGIVLLLGAPLGSPELLTTWQISGALVVGGSSSPLSGIVLIRDAAVNVGTLAAPGNVVIDVGGAILGTGTRQNLLRVVGGGLITNDGLISGPVTLDGRYDPASTGVILSRFSGFPPSPQQLAARSPAGAIAALGAPRRKPPLPAQGPVVFTGDAELGGTLVLQFLNGFAPAQGNAFEVVEAGGSVIGAFSDVVVQGLAPGALFEETVQDGVLTLTSSKDATALPTVSLKAKAKLKEKKKSGAVTFKRSGDTSQPMLVSYQVGGTASNGLDYELLPGVIEIPAGKKSAKLAIRPFREGLPEVPETIDIELLPGEDYAPSLFSQVAIELLSSD